MTRFTALAIGIAVLSAPVLACAPAAGQPGRAAVSATPESFGARGDGVADDSAALQKALNAGGTVHLTAGRQYRITHRIFVPSGAGMTSDGGMAWIVIGTRPGEFGDRTDFGLYVNNATGVTLQNFGLRLEYRDPAYVHGIGVLSSSNVTIKGLEIKDFAELYGVIVRGSHDVTLDGNYVHDFRINAAPDCGLDPPARVPTSSDRPDGSCGKVIGLKVEPGRNGDAWVESYNVRITNNRIENLKVGPEFERLWGYQSEAINVASPQDSDALPVTWLSHDILISGNRIKNVGIGINSYSLRARIVGNTIENPAKFGIELIHGAQDNLVQGNVINRPAYAGIYVRGSPKERTVRGNVVTGNTVTGVGQDGLPHPHGDWAGFGHYAVYCQNATDTTVGANVVQGAPDGALLDRCVGTRASPPGR